MRNNFSAWLYALADISFRVFFIPRFFEKCAEGSGAINVRAYLGDSDGDLNYTNQILSLDSYTYKGRTQLADVNGDGFADLIEFPFSAGGSSHAYVHIADETGKFSTSIKDTALCEANDPGRVFMADVNGDGLADIVQTDAQGSNVYVHLADGQGYFDACSAPTDLGMATDPGTVMFGDINGDGLSDLIVAPGQSNSVHTWFANGNGGFESAKQTDTNLTNDNGYTQIADVNADGFADLIKAQKTSSTVSLYLGDGTGRFSSRVDKSTNNSGFFAVVDTNGDGLADLHRFETQNNDVYSYMAEGLSGNDIHADLLRRIDNGYDVTATVNYALSTSFNAVHAPSGSFPNAYLPFTTDFVTAIVIDDGIGNQEITTTYEYLGAHYSTQEREFIGLGRIIKINPDPQKTTHTTDYAVDDYYLKGRAISSDYDDNASSDFVHTAYNWIKSAIQDGAQWVRLNDEKSDFHSGGTTVDHDIDYYYEYPSQKFGYLFKKVESGDGESNLTTQTTYAKYGGSGEWILRVNDMRILLGSTTARHVGYGYDGNGNNTRETHYNNNGSDAVIDRDFDTYGNLDWEDDPNGNRTDYSYSDGTYLSSESFEGLTTSYYNHNQWGKPERSTDANGQNTDFTYDDYGRVTVEDYPGPGEKTTDYYDTARPRYTVAQIDNGQDTYTYMDGLGRTLQTTSRSASGNKITTRNYYDGAGRQYNTVGPFFTTGYVLTSTIPNDAPYKRITAFDFLNRPKTIQSPGDSGGTISTTISYSGFNRTIEDPDGKPTTENRDYLGRIQSIRDAYNKATAYEYNGAGDLTRVTDSMGHSIGITRNTLGHMRSLDDPDLGHWTYTYKPNGEVLTRTDQKGQVITYGYNSRNQLTSKTYSTAEPGVSLSYNSAVNGNGRLYTVTKDNVTTTYNAYDPMGRVTQKTVTIDGQNYVFGYQYDAAGNMTSITYPDDYTVTFGYHGGTRLISSITASNPAVGLSLPDYSNFEKIERIQYPAFATTIGYYDRTGRVHTINVPNLMALTYSYSDAGDVTGLYDSIRNFSHVYGYDDLHRLRSESAIGPFKSPADRDINLYYETTEPHAVSRVVADGGERSLIYEDNGNLTNGYDFSSPGQYPQRFIQYNTENMPVSIEYTPEGGPATTVALTYDGDGRRVKKQAGADTVIYVDNTYEIRNGQPVKYIFAGSRRLAKVTGSTVRYYHKDHLGSSSLVTDASGSLVDSMVFEAFGQPRETCQPVSGDVAYTYTDQEWDAESGLYNYDARLYDAVLGRFVSADSVVPNYFDMQALDRYAYVQNNPLKYNDPDGHFAVLAGFIVVKLGAMAIAYVGTHTAVSATEALDSRANDGAATQMRQNVNNAFATTAKVNASEAAAMAGGEIAGVAIGATFRFAKGIVRRGVKAATESVTEVVENSAKASKGKVSKAADAIEDYLGPGAKPKINEAGDLVIESADGAKKVRFDINDPSPHNSPHGHVEEFKKVKNKMKPKYKSGPIYPKDVPHE